MKRELTEDEKKLLEKADPKTRELLEKFGFDAFDDYDCRPEGGMSEQEKAQRDARLPDHVKQAIAARKGKQTQQ